MLWQGEVRAAPVAAEAENSSLIWTWRILLLVTKLVSRSCMLADQGVPQYNGQQAVDACAPATSEAAHLV